MAFDEKTAARVRVVLSDRRDVTEKKMMGGLCFMVKGGMCCSVSGRGGLLVRIDPKDQAQVLREPHAQPMEMGRRTLKGFVRVAPEAYRTEALLQKWVMRGIEAVETRAAKDKTHKRMPATAAKS